MRIFVHEHVSGGGMAGAPLPESLRREGWAMLRSIVEDLARVNGVERVVTTLDPKLLSLEEELGRGRVEVVPVPREGAIEMTFRRLARECDATLVIAPELGGALRDRTRWALEEDARPLGSALGAVELAGDKLATAKALLARGIPAAPLQPVDLSRPPPHGATYPLVLKPRHGAGSQWIYLLEGADKAPRVFLQALSEGAPREMVMGPLVRGLPASASFLIGPRRVLPLLPGEQVLSGDGRFRYLGGRIPLPPPFADRAVRLAERAARAIPGLRGFVGVDLVLGESAPESTPSDLVIEVNPRLTTSYVGLRALTRTNLAEAWLALERGVDVPLVEWYGGEVSFLPDGSLQSGETKDR